MLHHARQTWTAVAILTVVSAAMASQLTIDSNMLSLMPEDDPTIQALKQLEAEEAGVNLVTIAVEGDPEASAAFLSEVQAELEDHPGVRYTLYDLDPDLAWRLGVLQLSPEELTTIRDRLEGALALGAAITNPFVASRVLDLGPLTAKLKDADAQQGSVLSSQEFARLVVRPTEPANHIPFARALMGDIDRVLEALDPESRGVRVVWIGGNYRHNVEDFEGIRYDMSWTVVASFGLVFGFLTLAFRDPRILLLIFTPLVLASIWTFGFAWISVRTLNTFTSFFGAVLIGLGIDFAIHLYTRYREERRNADTLEDAIIRAWDRVGPPCATAALTTAAGFSALLIARFKGFAQLGVVLAVGVVLCLTAVLVIMPLLIQWRERRPTRRPSAEVDVSERSRPPTYQLAPVGLLLAVLITGLAALLVPRMAFEYDLSELRRDGMAWEDLDASQQRLVRSSYTPVVVTYPDEASLRSAHDTYAAKIEAGELPQFSRAVSIQTAIPADQADRLALLEEIKALSEDESYRYLPAQVRQNLAPLEETALEPLQASALPYGLQHLLGAADGHNRLLLFPTGNMWDLRETEALLTTSETVITDGDSAGEFLSMGALYRQVRRDMPTVAGLALLVISITTLLDLRRPLRALGAVSVLVAGMVWAGAAAAILGVKLSLVNIMGVPILMGVGIDVVIHLLHRLSEEGPGNVLKALSTTGLAVVLSTTTTVLSFASLTLASSKGVQSLGMIVVVGLIAVTLAAFALLPVGWMTSWKIGGLLDEDE